MTHANDNLLSREFLELQELTIQEGFGWNLQKLRCSSPRAIYNFLWFAKFDIAFRSEQIKLRRKKIEVAR